MATKYFTGSSVAVRKVMRLTLGEEFTTPMQIGLGVKFVTVLVPTAESIVSAWADAAASDQLLRTVNAELTDSPDEVQFVSATVGDDFELTIKLLDGDEYQLVDQISELQRITFSNNSTGGTFTLTYSGQTTGNITLNPADSAATALAIESALEALSNIQVGDVTVTAVDGVTYDVSFANGRFHGVDVEQMTLNFSGLTGGNATVAVATTQNGSTGQNEIQTLSMPGYDTYTSTEDEIQTLSLIGNPTSGNFALFYFGYGTTAAIAYNANRVAIKAALEGVFGVGSVVVTGGALPNLVTIRFTGSLSGVDVPEPDVVSNTLTSGDAPEVVISEVRDGVEGNTASVTIDTIIEGVAGGSPATTNVKLSPTKSSSSLLSSTDPSGFTETAVKVGIHTVSSVDYQRKSVLRFVPGSTIRDNWIAEGSIPADQKLRLFVSAYNSAHDVAFRVYGKANVNSTTNSSLMSDVATGLTTAFTAVPEGAWTPGTEVEIDITAVLQELWDDVNFLSCYLVLVPVSAAAGDAEKIVTFHASSASDVALRPELEAVTVSAGTSEVQKYTVADAVGGQITFDVDSNEIGPVPYNCSRAQFETAVREVYATASVSGTTLTSTGLTVTYPTEEGNLPEATADLSELISDPGIAEIQQVLITGNAASGNVTLTFDGLELAPLPYNATATEAAEIASLQYPGTTCTGGPWPAAIQFVFPSDFGDLAVGTSTDTLDGPTFTAVTSTVVDGGSQERYTITGGVFALGFSKSNSVSWVVDIPYNVDAAQLQTLINAVLGASSVTVTGTAMPAGELEIEFTGNGWNDVSVQPTLYRMSFDGNSGIDVQSNVIRRAKFVEDTSNTHDFVIIPGRGTLGLNRSPSWDAASGQCNWGRFKIVLADGQRLLTDSFRWVDCTPLDVENVINEMFGKDVCRVYQTVHSIEYARVPNTYGGIGATSARPAWYFRDVYRIVFHSEYAAAASFDEFTFELPDVTEGETTRDLKPEDFLVPQSEQSYDDATLEAARVRLAFVLADSIGDPLHRIEIEPSTVESTELEFRFKLLDKYVDGIYGETSENATEDPGRVFYGEIAPDMKIRFYWERRVVTNTEEGQSSSVNPTPLGETPDLDWDSPASVIQEYLQTITTGLFGPGNVIVTGGLRNSHLPEGTIDGEESDSYSDLRVRLTGSLTHLPLEEMGYYLRMAIVNSTAAAAGSASTPNQYNTPYPWVDIVARPIPPFQSERVRLTISSFANVSTMFVVVGDVFIPVTQATTAAEIETALNAAYGKMGTAPSDNITPPSLPTKYGKSFTVYGTTVGAGPIEIEFSGYGNQFSVPDVSAHYAVFAEDVIELVTTQEGIAPRPEIKTLTLTPSTWAGSFKVEFGGDETATIAFNASNATVDSEIESLTGIGSGNVAVTGGPLPGTLVLTFNSALGDIGTMTATVVSTLKNQRGDVGTLVNGGSSDDFYTLEELVKGAGPTFLDVAENYVDNKCISSGDTIIVDDAVRPITFGIGSKASFRTQGLGSGGKLRFLRNRRVFLDGQKVWVRSTDTLPAGLTEGYFYVVNSDRFMTFQLSETLGGAAVVINDPGVGTHSVELRELTLRVYSRFVGASIGLPNRRGTGELEYLPRYFAAGFDDIVLGIEEGNGLTLGRFDTLDQEAHVEIFQTGQSNDSIPSVLFLFNNADSDLTMYSGQVGIAVYPGEQSSLRTFTQHDGTLVIGQAEFAEGVRGLGGERTLLDATVGGSIQFI